MAEQAPGGRVPNALRKVLVPLAGTVHPQLRRLEHERDDQ
jgi:hypothetical protein